MRLISFLTFLFTFIVLFLFLIRNQSILILIDAEEKHIDIYNLFFSTVTTNPKEPVDYTLQIDTRTNIPNPLVLRLWLFMTNCENITTDHWSLTSTEHNDNFKDEIKKEQDGL